LIGLRKGYIFVGEGPGIRNCNTVGCGSRRVSRIFMVIKIIKYLVIYVVLKRVLKKKTNLEPDGSLKFFHPPKLGALFDSANFQIPRTDGSESSGYVIPPPPPFSPHWLILGVFFFFGENFLARIPSIN
jgi:hypothetical protein